MAKSYVSIPPTLPEKKNYLVFNNPILIPNPEKLMQNPKQNVTTVRSPLSLNVEDLFYSVPHKKMIEAVRECIETNETVSFQKQCGILLDSLLELLKFYLTYTVVTFSNNVVIQKKGICIGLCVAPVLCNIFLAQCDPNIALKLPANLASRVFRCVDEYIFLLH